MTGAQLNFTIFGGIAAFALLMRWLSADDPGPDLEEESPPALGDTSQPTPVEIGTRPMDVVAITSDGWAFVPDDDEVQLIPPGEIPDVWPIKSPTLIEFNSYPLVMSVPIDPRTRRRLPSWKPGLHFDRGDLLAARVVTGLPDSGPWRLEALGRDLEYRSWSFESEDAARAALALLRWRVVRPPRDRQGAAFKFGDRDYEAARERARATERDLELPVEVLWAVQGAAR